MKYKDIEKFFKNDVKEKYMNYVNTILHRLNIKEQGNYSVPDFYWYIWEQVDLEKEVKILFMNDEVNLMYPDFKQFNKYCGVVEDNESIVIFICQKDLSPAVYQKKYSAWSGYNSDGKCKFVAPDAKHIISTVTEFMESLEY